VELFVIRGRASEVFMMAALIGAIAYWR